VAPLLDHIALHLRNIYLQHLSGVLSFKRESVQKQLFFQNGDLVQAKTNQPEERLGEILFKLGKISEEVHAELERYADSHLPIGRSLASKGLTSQRNIVDGLIYQLREITLGLFPYFDGSFTFQENVALREQTFSARLNLPYLIEDGIRRMKFRPEIEKFLAKRIPFQRDREFIHLLTQEEKELLSQIKGSMTSDALWRALKYNPEFFWRTLYLMYCLNLVDFTDREIQTASISPEEPEPPRPAETQEKLDEVTSFLNRIPNLNYYQILGVPKSASEEEIKKAYFNLARKFHPDRFDRSVSADDHARIDEVFDKITKAYRTLINPELRKQYDHKAPERPAGEAKDVVKIAETKFRQAKTLFHMARYEEAVVYLEEVVRLVKNKGSYFLLLGMAQAKIPALRKQAEQSFLKAQELEPWNAEAFVGLGMLYKQEGMTTKATRQFQKALEFDADHAVARKELEAMTGGERKKGLKSLLSMDLFGSKKGKK